MEPQPADAWTLLAVGAAAGLAGAWVLRSVVRAVRRAIAPALRDAGRGGNGADSGNGRADLEQRNAQLERERAAERERRRVLSDMNEMLLLQKEELEGRARELAAANAELERMEQMTAWQQEALSERNDALERQTAEAERLSRELAGRVNELNAALAQIERLHRDHEAFLRHELRNAISPILGYVALLEAEDAGADAGPNAGAGHASKWLMGIRESAEATERLLTQLKDLQAIERGTRTIERSPVALDDLVRSAVRAVDPRGEIPFDLDLQPVRVPGDPSLLPGVLVNLVRNAVEHVRNGSDPTVGIRTTIEQDRAVVRVHNGGPAIPGDVLDRFFDRFNSTKTGGTGLGTSYVFLVVRAHGGDVSVESTDTAGTTVTVRLPIDRADAG